MKGKNNKRALRNPPGKLLTGKGPIPGDLGAFGEVWGKFNVTGDQAERMMGFRPKEGAIGVVLSRRKYMDENGKVKRGIFASSIMPPKLPNTEKENAVHERITLITHIASEYHDDLIVPIWNPLIKNDRKKPYTGHHYFMSTNLNSVGLSLNWRKLLISKGKLKPPTRLISNWFNPDTQEIKICIPSKTMNQIGIGIIDIVTGSFFHIPPGKTGILPVNHFTWKLQKIRKYYKKNESLSYEYYYSRFYIYMYYRKPKTDNRKPIYSPSISSRMLVYKNREDRRNTKPITIKIET